MGIGPDEQFEDRIRRIATEVAGTHGLELVELRIGRAKKRRHIRLDIDRAGPRGVDIDDCQRVSRQVEAILEDDDMVNGSYVLEVSSPGLDRPIRTADDFRRNRGRRVVVETAEPLEGRRSFTGLLVGIDDDRLRIREDEREEIGIPLHLVSLARQEIAF